MPKTEKEILTQYPIYKYFAYSHLPDHLQAVSKPFSDIAKTMVMGKERNEERSTGLRKLLEAKDCFVRAMI